MYTIRFYSFLMHNSPIIYNDQRPSVHPFLYFILTLLNNSTFVFRESETILSEQKRIVKHFFKLFLTFFQNASFSLFFKRLRLRFWPYSIAFVQFYAAILALILRSNHILKPMLSYIGIQLHDADPALDKYPPNAH